MRPCGCEVAIEMEATLPDASARGSEKGKRPYCEGDSGWCSHSCAAKNKNVTVDLRDLRATAQ
jgi:hypothetical protein